MTLVRNALVALFLGIALSLSACGGGGAKVSTSNVSVTKGQQLMDLQKAYEAGIITEKEYNKQKEAILKSSY